ncbi:MAG TPA: diphosphate--fructose-6-phosphate 1-phosphotransferase [Fibrobacteria bacterium]|nr:diphosphate--fructose-6-phosphate 1-phosphotransferase [Fibrobacteria bacterium]
MSQVSILEKHRKQYQPKVPPSLRHGIATVKVVEGAAAEPAKDREAIRKSFPNTYGKPLITFQSGSDAGESKPLRIGVVLSGGQAPGGHNVIAGLFDSVGAIHPQSQIFGFLGGPGGLEKGKYEAITPEKMDAYRNTGGFDIIGSDRTKLETPEQFDRCIEVIKGLELNAVVIIGGDDSNTNAAILAEYLKAKGLSTSVIGVPKTIDGDLKNPHIPVSFGFDTAVKTYAELIGNIARDAGSAKKYWHFIKLMGRSASHIALEAGLQTHANVTLVSEEVEKRNLSLEQIVDDIARVISARADAGKNYGVVLIPEGLIEFIPSVKKLISRLNDLLAGNLDVAKAFANQDSPEAKIAYISDLLKADAATADLGKTFASLPKNIQLQLLLDRDPHGNVQVSLIDTDALLAELVGRKLKASPAYKGKFSSQRHFFGYEGRAAAPSNFDADYCYSLGCVAAILVRNGRTGYMASIRNVSKGVDQWSAGGIPITMMFNMEQRHGHLKPVIQKALVELEGPAFKALVQSRAQWEIQDAFIYPGPIQYFGPAEVCDAITKTLELEQG